MTLESGHTLLQYRVVEQIGEGGMGVVWRATDTALDRDAAIKVLPPNVADDDERLGRFEREAKMLAALSHPNIASVYGFHAADDCRFIAMEFVEGETLSARLSGPHGLRSTDERLSVFRQLADALETAHDRGIIHRDLKPANIVIRPDGTVKVLDFGLARMITEDPQADSLPSAPTEVGGFTEPGMVLGTVPYMSPEQARGNRVDRRTDIWALGCIIYECLVGRRPFGGDTPTDTLAQIVSHEPDFGALPDDTPVFLTHLLRRCLEKDPRRRLRDAGELRFAIESYQTDPKSVEIVGTAPTAVSGHRVGTIVPWLLVAALVAFVYISRRGGGGVVDHASVSQWRVNLPADTRLGYPGRGGRFDYSRLVAIAPDGSRVAYAVQDRDKRVQLYVREINEIDPRLIAGTDGARAAFFSPDGQWLGFITRDALMRVALSGGAPQKICDTGRVISFDATWSPDSKIVIFATDDGLWRVAASGGEPEALTVPDTTRGEVGHHTPRFTPDSRYVLFTISVTPETHLARLDLESGTWEVVIRNAAQGVPLDDGRIVFARSGELLVSSSASDGSHETVLQNVHTTPGLGGVVLTHFDISQTGTLVYVPEADAKPDDQLVWVDQSGNENPITGGPGTWVHPRLSPDATRVSFDIHAPDGMRDLYVYDLSKGQLNRLTNNGITWESEWHPDGRRIAAMSGAPAGQWSLFWLSSDLSKGPELFHRANHAVPAVWSADGQTLFFHELVTGGSWHIKPESGGKAEEFMHTAANERFVAFSPDEKWVAYTADESGRPEVFVQSYPNMGAKHRVSINGGGEVRWSRDGRQLFFRQGDAMFAVDVELSPSFRAGRPKVLFHRADYYDDAQGSGHQHYDLSLDGKRFLMIKRGDQIGPSEVRVVLGWTADL